MTGTASIRATATGIELRQGRNTVRLYRHQLIPFCDFAIDWAEQLDSSTTNTEEKNDD